MNLTRRERSLRGLAAILRPHKQKSTSVSIPGPVVVAFLRDGQATPFKFMTAAKAIVYGGNSGSADPGEPISGSMRSNFTRPKLVIAWPISGAPLKFDGLSEVQFSSGERIQLTGDSMDAAIGSIITTTTIPSVGTSTGPFIDKPTVLAVQKALITKGYSVGKSGADGLWGKDTAQGIKSFQGMRGETQTGVINIQLCNALGVAVPGARTDVTVSAAAQDVANVANNAAGEAAKADTPAAVKDVAKVVETAAVAQPPAPPAVQAEVKKAVAQAQAAKTPEEVKLAAAAVSAAGVSVAKAAVAGWWVQPAWVGAPLKRWHAVAGAGAAVALSTVLIAVLRRKK